MIILHFNWRPKPVEWFFEHYPIYKEISDNLDHRNHIELEKVFNESFMICLAVNEAFYNNSNTFVYKTKPFIWLDDHNDVENEGVAYLYALLILTCNGDNSKIKIHYDTLYERAKYLHKEVDYDQCIEMFCKSGLQEKYRDVVFTFQCDGPYPPSNNDYYAWKLISEIAHSTVAIEFIVNSYDSYEERIDVIDIFKQLYTPRYSPFDNEVNSYYFGYLRAIVNNQFGYPLGDSEKYLGIVFNHDFNSHYPKELDIDTMSATKSIIDSFRMDYTTERLRKIRSVEKFYEQIKEYELQIMSDYEYIDNDFALKSSLDSDICLNHYALSIKTIRGIAAMKELCGYYHTIVKAYKQLSEYDFNDNSQKQKKSSSRTSPIYALSDFGKSNEANARKCAQKAYVNSWGSGNMNAYLIRALFEKRIIKNLNATPAVRLLMHWDLFAGDVDTIADNIDEKVKKIKGENPKQWNVDSGELKSYYDILDAFEDCFPTLKSE